MYEHSMNVHLRQTLWIWDLHSHKKCTVTRYQCGFDFAITVSWSSEMLCSIHEDLWHPTYLQNKQDCIPVGCIPPACWPYLPACTAQGGAWSKGGVWSGGCLLGGCLVGGVWGLLGGMVSQHALRQTPPWTEFLTHATENITLPQTSFAGGKNIWYLAAMGSSIFLNFINRFGIQTLASQWTFSLLFVLLQCKMSHLEATWGNDPYCYMKVLQWRCYNLKGQMFKIIYTIFFWSVF